MRTRRLRWAPHDVGLYFHHGLYLDGHFQRRRPYTWANLIWDAVFWIALPFLTLVSMGVLLWILVAIGRAVRSMGGT